MFWRRVSRGNENTRIAWGYSFEVDPRYHLPITELEPLKYSYDVLGERVLETLDAMSASPIGSDLSGPPSIKQNGMSAETGSTSTLSRPKEDLFLLLKENATKDPVLLQFWAEIHTVPSWIDWGQLARGQDVFYRYGGAALTGLAFQSLLGGMGNSRVVETLARTGGFSTKVARHRLYETTQHILQCTRSLTSIQPGGDGHASSVRVRLLHAAVRRRILTLAKQRPNYYDVDKFGIPINDLDSMGTIVTFSATLIWISLPRQGIWMRRQEEIDFIALWRYIAYLTGTPNECFSTPEKAKGIMDVLLFYEISPSELSKDLAHNVIRSLEAQPPSFASRPMLEASSRWMNGNELCDALGLGKPGLYYRMLMAGQCIFFMAICYSYRTVPYLDRRKISVSSPEVVLKVEPDCRQGSS